MNLMLAEPMTEHEAHLEETTARRAELREKLPEASRNAARIPLLEQEIKRATEAAGEDPSQRPKLRELQAEFSAILDAIRDGITVDSINAKLAQTAPAGLRIRHAALTAVHNDLSAAIKAHRKKIEHLGAASCPRSEATVDVLAELAAKVSAEADELWQRMLND